jgi:hypothetical protein
LREAREHRQVGLEGYSVDAAHSERGEAEVMLEVSVLSFHGLPSRLEVAEPLSVPLDAGVEAGSTFDDRHDDLRPLLALQWDDREHVALHALGVTRLES